MFMAPLLIMDKNLELTQISISSGREKQIVVQYTYTMDCCAAIKNEIPSKKHVCISNNMLNKRR